MWSNAELLEVAQRRERLRKRVDVFNRSAVKYLQGIGQLQNIPGDIAPLNDEHSDEEEDPFRPSYKELFMGEPESRVLHLPSMLGEEECIRLKLGSIMRKEVALREGQANDALQGLRRGIGEKSFRFRGHLRFAKGNIEKTRARSGIKSVSRALNHQRRVYSFARRALISLGAESEEASETYKEVSLADLKASTVIYDINAPGKRNKNLAWFWSTHVMGNHTEDGVMTECKSHISWPDNFSVTQIVYRVHWLAARERCQRWEEELAITTHEMEWTTRFFLAKAKQWMLLRNQALASGKLHESGQVCYAEKQQAMWCDFAAHAQNRYQTSNTAFVYIPIQE